MNADDLARALHGANITININNGRDQYTGPTQVNHHYAPQQSAKWICPSCGVGMNSAWDVTESGMCRSCNHAALKAANEERYEAQHLESMKHTRDRDVIIDSATGQIIGYASNTSIDRPLTYEPQHCTPSAED